MSKIQLAKKKCKQVYHKLVINKLHPMNFKLGGCMQFIFCQCNLRYDVIGQRSSMHRISYFWTYPHVREILAFTCIWVQELSLFFNHNAYSVQIRIVADHDVLSLSQLHTVEIRVVYVTSFKTVLCFSNNLWENFCKQELYEGVCLC